MPPGRVERWEAWGQRPQGLGDLQRQRDPGRSPGFCPGCPVSPIHGENRVSLGRERVWKREASTQVLGLNGPSSEPQIPLSGPHAPLSRGDQEP